MKDILQVLGIGVAMLYFVFVLASLAWMRHVARVTRRYLAGHPRYVGWDEGGPDRTAEVPMAVGHRHTEFCLDANGRDCPDRTGPR